MRFTSQPPLSIPPSHYSDLAKPREENGETPAMAERVAETVAER